MIYVQFLEEEEVTIISWFSGPQDPVYYPYFAAITADDPRWVVYFESMPPDLQEVLPKPIYP